ncbi:zinc ribbon domain-containing protein [Nonomuraea wenchangensis]|uniref:zinc ribbon domain-containing protein n=1 Tax=Nonomuraea wenchangensis TaxID=568860 RepID=UPI00331E71C6
MNSANTSRRCAECGHAAPKCQACGHTARADVNGAVNIRGAGLALRQAAQAA